MRKRVLTAIMIFSLLGLFALSACTKDDGGGTTAPPTTEPGTTAPQSTAPTTAPSTTELPTTEPAANKIETTGNLLKITTKEDFEAGTMKGLVYSDEIGNGALIMEEGVSLATFTSAIYTGMDFEYLVASWNADLPELTSIEVFARALVKKDPGSNEEGKWSQWLSWGQWGTHIKRGSTRDSDDIVFMSTDEFSVLGSSGGVEVQLKAVLMRDNPSAEAPVLRQLAATWANTNDGRAVTPLYAEEPVELAKEVRLKAPAYAQMNRDPVIGDSICSPLTASILMNDRDNSADLFPEEVALIAQDFKYGFGNWSYTMATAGSYGYEAYVQYASFDIIMQELSKGNSVGISVRYSTDPKHGELPYLENGATPSTYGHLITITGYFYEGDELYFLSSDSAGNDDATSSGANCIYKASQLEKAWGQKKTAYIIPSKEKEQGAGAYNSKRTNVTLAHLADNTYTISDDNGDIINLGKDFTLQKTAVPGRGTIGFTVKGLEVKMPDNVTPVSANSTFFYNCRTDNDGNIVIDLAKAKAAAGKDELEITLYIFSNDGRTYISQPVKVK